jgi:hypothetical protein
MRTVASLCSLTKITLASLASFLLACGGGGGATSTPAVSWSQNLAGIWHGNLNSTPGGSETVIGASTQNGYFQFFSTTKDNAITGQVTPTGDGSTFNGTGFIQVSGEDSPRSISIDNGSLTTNASLGCDFTIPSLSSGDIQVFYDPIYELNVPIASLEGSYYDSKRSVTIMPDGTFTVMEEGNSFPGTLTRVAPGKNLFTFTFTSPEGTFSGLAFWCNESSYYLESGYLYCQWSKS